MSSAMLMERTTTGHTHFGTPAMTAPTGAPALGAMCMVPRCTVKLEKCKDGMKLWCHCEDEVACGALQNLCKMLSDGMCSVCCTMNGMALCQCNLTMGMCHCEHTKDGVCITCKSGDKTCCEMIQACCECLKCCLEAGCCCYVSYNGTPVCCGCC